MRLLASVCCLALGCRIGFDAGGGRDAGALTDSSDADGDASVTTRTCSAMPIAGFDLGTGGITDMAAATLPSGFALGFLRAPSFFIGVALSPTLAPNSDVPIKTSPTSTASTPIYLDSSLYWDGANLVGSLHDNTGPVWLKTFPTGMSTFLTAEARSGGFGEPSVGRAGRPITVWFQGKAVSYSDLDGAGVPTNPDRSIGTTPAPIVGATVAGVSFAVIATALDDGSCFVHTIDSGSNTTSRPLAPVCARPHAAVAGNTVIIAYNAGGMVTAKAVTPLAIGTPKTLATGDTPRVFAAGELVAYRGADRLAVVDLSGADIPIIGLPAGLPDAYEVAGSHVFAVFGTTVHAIACP